MPLDPDEIDEDDSEGYNGAYARMLRHKASGLPFDEWKSREEVERAQRDAIRVARRDAELDRLLASVSGPPSAPPPPPDQKDPVSDDDENEESHDEPEQPSVTEIAALQREARIAERERQLEQGEPETPRAPNWITVEIGPPAIPSHHVDYDDDEEGETQAHQDSALWRLAFALDGDPSSRIYENEPNEVIEVEKLCPACQKCQIQFRWANVPKPSAIDTVTLRCLGGCGASALKRAAKRVIAEFEAEADTQFLDDEMDPERVETYAPQEWEIPALAPREALTLLRGESGNGKGWIVLYAAVCKALGLPYFGQPVKRGKVMVAFLESKRINERRLGPIVRGLGYTIRDLKGWLYLWPAGLPLKSDTPQGMAELARRVKRHKYELIFLDNTTRLRKSRKANAENDSSTLSGVLEPLADLATTGKIDGELVTKTLPAVVVLDHDRGSTAAEQNADFVVTVSRKSAQIDAPVTLAMEMGSRIVHEGLPMQVQFVGQQPNNITARLYGDEGDDSEEESKTVASVVRAIRDAGSEGMGLNELCRTAGYGKSLVTKIVKDLQSASRVTRADDKKYRLVT